MPRSVWRESTELSLAFDRPFFNEFTLRCDVRAAALRDRAAAAGFDVGPEVVDSHALFVAVTEQRTVAEIDALVRALDAAPFEST